MPPFTLMLVGMVPDGQHSFARLHSPVLTVARPDHHRLGGHGPAYWTHDHSTSWTGSPSVPVGHSSGLVCRTQARRVMEPEPMIHTDLIFPNAKSSDLHKYPCPCLDLRFHGDPGMHTHSHLSPADPADAAGG